MPRSSLGSLHTSPLPPDYSSHSYPQQKTSPPVRRAVAMLFTRDDEYEMDLLISTESERPLSEVEKQRLRDIQARYDVFIADGVRQLRDMAGTQSPRPARVPLAQLPQNLRFFLFCGLLAVIAVSGALLAPSGRGGGVAVIGFILRSHASLCVVLAVTVGAMAVTCLNRSFLRRALLTSVAVVLGTLALVSLFGYRYFRSHFADTAPEGESTPHRVLLFMFVMDTFAFAFNAWLFKAARWLPR